MKFRLFIFSFLICGLSFPILKAENGKAISKDGVEIAYTVDGLNASTDSPELVFIHGWSCDKSVWKNQISAFSPKYKVIAIDLGGHGESGINRKNWTLDSFAEDVFAVVNKLGLKKIILIGHSMGGPVSIEAANKLKGKVIGLIGADTFQNLGKTIPDSLISIFVKPFKENFSGSTKEFVKAMFPSNADPVLVKMISDKMSSAPPEIAMSAFENMFKDNAVSALKEFDAPIISINCDHYPVQVESNKKQVKFYELKIMKGVGHFVMLENPQEFNRLLQESVNELVNMQ
jgi:pimeloyl-ACP methyl ester carboxylesterase